MTDTTTLVATRRFRITNTLAADIQAWYRSLDVGTLKSVSALLEGQNVRLIVIYTAAS